MVKTRAANRPPALALADSAQHSGTPGARAHQRKNFNRAAAVAPVLAGGPGRASPGVLRRGCPAGASPPARAGGRRWCALPGVARAMHSKQAGEWALGVLGGSAPGSSPSQAAHSSACGGMPQNPISAMLKLACAPLASRGSTMRVGAAEDRATSHNAANSPSTQVRRWR